LQGDVIRTVFLTLLTLLCLGAGTAHARKPIVGFGEQNALFFSDPRWVDLDKNDKRYVRYVMPWDALHRLKTRTAVDIWMTEAKIRGARVLLTFGHSVRSKRRARRLPTRRQYRHEIRAVRKRYPFVRTFQTWNEANHGFQPTYRRPKATGRLYDVLVKTCRRCTVTAPSLLISGKQKELRWIKKFRRGAKRRIRIWAIHNHIDANRNTRKGTKQFLRHTHGPVWFTETGAIWNRWMPNRGRRKGWHKVRRYNHRTAVKAVRNIFKLQRLNQRRIRRIYVYNWYGLDTRRPRWDTGLIGPNGHERRTYRTLRAQMRKYAR
jgi:hypothetical protein